MELDIDALQMLPGQDIADMGQECSYTCSYTCSITAQN